MKSLSAFAVAALVAAGSAHADMQLAQSGNGGMSFQLWDDNGSYMLDMNITIDQFETAIAQDGLLRLEWDLTGDTVLTNYLASVADISALQWNILAGEGVGARRLLTTYTEPKQSPTRTNDIIRSAVGELERYQILVNQNLPDDDSAFSVAVNSGSDAWAGQQRFSNNLAGLFDFFNTGAVNSGINFMRINGNATGIANSVYNTYFDEGAPVIAFFGDDQRLYLSAAPVPEAETWGMLLAGLGLVGMMARRRARRV